MELTATHVTDTSSTPWRLLQSGPEKKVRAPIPPTYKSC